MNSNIKLLDMSNKFITSVDNMPVLKSKQSNLNQQFTYNSQGEIILDDKCLSYKPNNSVYFSSCNDGQEQKWNFDYNIISPKSDPQKCLTSNNDKVSVEQCKQDGDDSQIWDVEYESKTPNDFSWNSVKGKSVVLVQSDDPWYINQDTTIPMKYNQDFNINNDLSYRDNADYQSNFVMDRTKRDMGYGYSYADRLGQCCSKKVEGFGEKCNDQSSIIVIVLIVIILLLIFKHIKN